MYDVVNMDVREGLASLPERHFHCCVTSPPYFGLRDYGIEGQLGLEPTPQEYVANMVEVCRGIRRVLRDDAVFFLNIGDSYNGYYANQRATSLSAANQESRPYLEPGAGLRCAGLKPKDMCLIPERLLIALQEDGWWVRSKIVWAKRCLSGGAIVYARTQKGDMPMMVKDLVRLRPETVKLWDGEKWTQCVGFTRTTPDKAARKLRTQRRHASYRTGDQVAPSGELEIELASGERIGCTANHRWPIGDGEKFAADLKLGDALNARRLPEPESPWTPAAYPDWMGFVTGLYLAEGCQSNDSLHFSLNRDEGDLARQIAKWAEHIGCTSTARNGTANGMVVSVYGRMAVVLVNEYLSRGTSRTKRLLPACWARSNRFLLHLAMGYLRGDGHNDHTNNRWRLGFTCNDGLASDLRTIGARLGWSVRLKRAVHTCNGKAFPGWRGSVVFKPSARKQSDGTVIAIRHSRARCYWDIAVADQPNWFCLASGIVSHNSPMPESVTDRPTSAWEPIFLLAKSQTYYYDHVAVMEPCQSGPSDIRKMLEGLDRIGGKQVMNLDPLAASNANTNVGRKRAVGNPGGRNMRNVWTLSSEPVREAHFATFPSEIPHRAIAAGTSERGCCPECGGPWKRIVSREGQQPGRERNVGGRTDGLTRPAQWENGENPTTVTTTGWQPTCKCNAGEPVPCRVLEPFAGSGTTLLEAIRMGRDAVGIELNPEYVEIIRRRIDQSAPLLAGVG